jgi:hypothetical protein
MEPFDGSNLPGCPDALICIDHLEHRFDEPAVRDFMLSFLEDLIYRHKRRVWVAADREPLGQLRKVYETRPAATTPEADANSGPAVDLDRWARVFQSFRLEIVGVAGQPISDGLEHALEARGFDAASADPYYRSVWSSCSSDEKLALRQLADEGVVNPRNHIVLEQLLRKGLARRDSTFRIMNDTFRRFIVRETPAEQVDAWDAVEHYQDNAGHGGAWPVGIAGAHATTAALCVGRLCPGARACGSHRAQVVCQPAARSKSRDPQRMTIRRFRRPSPRYLASCSMISALRSPSWHAASHISSVDRCFARTFGIAIFQGCVKTLGSSMVAS